MAHFIDFDADDLSADVNQWQRDRADIEAEHAPRRPRLAAHWLPANQCWQVQYGDCPTSIGVDGDWRTLFATRDDLDWWCRLAGLTTRRLGDVLLLQVAR